MVSEIQFTKEINKDIHRELMREDMDKFIKLWEEKKTIPVLFSKKAMEAWILKKIWHLLDNKKPICDKMGLSLDNCKKKLKRKTFPKSVTNLIDFYGETLAYQKSLRYNSLKIDLSWKIVELILAEELFKAGYSASKVSKMLGIHIRKSFRIKKRLKENGEI